MKTSSEFSKDPLERRLSVDLPSCSSLLSLAAGAWSRRPRPNRSASSLCLKEITVGFRGSGAAANCVSSSEMSDRSSSLTGNMSWRETVRGGGKK